MRTCIIRNEALLMYNTFQLICLFFITIIRFSKFHFAIALSLLKAFVQIYSNLIIEFNYFVNDLNYGAL